MKILIISAAFPPLRAGEADHALHLCERLAERGHDIHVLTTKRDAVRINVPFKLHPVMPHWLWPDLPFLAMFLRSCSPDAILLIYSDRDYNRHPMITFAAGISKALLPSVPFVTQLETEYISRQASMATRAALKAVAYVVGPPKFDYVFGTLLSKSDRIIVLSERYLGELSRRFRGINNKGIVIPPPPILRICPENAGASRRRGREALGVKAEEFLLAYYGYVYEEKGIETLFHAFKILNAHRCNTRLVMIGGVEGETHSSSYIVSLRGLARQLGIESKIIWTGEYSSDSDEASLYLHAVDACVFPFKYGVTLNRSSLAAAAAHGLPIITTEGKSVESPFVNQENLLLCPPEQPDSLARAIAAVIDGRPLRDRLHTGALKLAAEHFSWDKAVERTLAAFRQCQTVV
jgi:glycosyltransferase involved in cell wall biosynthesis